MPRVRLATTLMLLMVAGSGAACVHVTAVGLESSPLLAQTNVKLASTGCVPTAPMPIIGLKLGAPKPLPPREHNMPVIRLSACYLEADRAASIKRIVPSRDTMQPRRNQK